jgi:hypothetical protein
MLGADLVFSGERNIEDAGSELVQPTDEELCAHLIDRERALLDPAVRRDCALVSELLAEGFLEIGSSGNVWSREQILELLAAEDYRQPAMEDFKCALIAEGVALVTYRTVRMDTQSGDRTTTVRSSLWTKQSGRWRVRFHQGTKALP